MESLNGYVAEYTRLVKQGSIQKAYKGIMDFMSGLKAHLEQKYKDYSAGALYFGYMDMTYFAFTPPALRDRKLKIAIVYMHEQCCFELWLAGNNRRVQADCIEMLKGRDIGDFVLSSAAPGVDSIIAKTIIHKPDFDSPGELKKQIEESVTEFSNAMDSIIG